MATLTLTGIGESLVVRGAVDRGVVEVFVERVLVPSLHSGQIVVLGTCCVHKRAYARTVIEAAGCDLVFVPTYAPDVTPIERALATTRQALRRVGARSFATIVAAVGAALSTITTDAHAFFAHAGFPLASPELCMLL